MEFGEAKGKVARVGHERMLMFCCSLMHRRGGGGEVKDVEGEGRGRMWLVCWGG